MSVTLLFPPTWSLNTGSPHVALPLLKAFLQANGVEVKVLDLNWEAAEFFQAAVTGGTAIQACAFPTLESMNVPYFAVEDKLMVIARSYNGSWNAQLGFKYDSFSHCSSEDVLLAARMESPFTDYYKRWVLPRLSRENPAVIGMCIASVYQLVPALQLCWMLRRAGYDGVIVLGGNTVSRLKNEMQKREVFELVDALVTFRGEMPLLRLSEALRKGQSFERVPQLMWCSGNTIKVNEHVELLDPNSLPTPDYRDVPIGEYWGVNYLNLLSAFGCYYGKCKFCAIPYGWGEAGFAGVRRAELVYQDMLSLIERHGVRRFKFVDEAFMPSVMKKLAEMILRDGIHVEWEAYTRLESCWLDEDFVELVAAAGFRKGYFGLEILPSAGRIALNKKDRPDPFILMKNCWRAGVKVHYFCMFGFPGTGREDAEATVQFLLEHQNMVDTADIFPWSYAKHTVVPGVDPIIDPRLDWALEFDHRPRARGVLDSQEVRALAEEYEELLWDEVPRLLHPTYRLVSPWLNGAPGNHSFVCPEVMTVGVSRLK